MQWWRRVQSLVSRGHPTPHQHRTLTLLRPFSFLRHTARSSLDSSSADTHVVGGCKYLHNQPMPLKHQAIRFYFALTLWPPAKAKVTESGIKWQSQKHGRYEKKKLTETFAYNIQYSSICCVRRPASWTNTPDCRFTHHLYGSKTK